MSIAAVFARGAFQQTVRCADRDSGFALRGSQLCVIRGGFFAHQIAGCIGVRARISQDVHQLVRESDRQVARASGNPHGIGHLGTPARVGATNGLGIERGLMERVIDKEYRGPA